MSEETTRRWGGNEKEKRDKKEWGGVESAGIYILLWGRYIESDRRCSGWIGVKWQWRGVNNLQLRLSGYIRV
jgi:hypothetical protein